MSSIKKKDLQKIYNKEIDYLYDGLNNINNPYHFFCLSTNFNNNPFSRTVVLRNIKKNPLRLFFNADIRSPKINHLQISSNCSVLFYDNKRRKQLRFLCTAKIHHQNQTSRNIWDKTPLQSRKCYMGKFSPSSIVENYEPNIPKKYLKSDPSIEDSKQGYDNFSSVELQIYNSDILELHHDGHIRFNIDAKNNYKFIAP